MIITHNQYHFHLVASYISTTTVLFNKSFTQKSYYFISEMDSSKPDFTPPPSFSMAEALLVLAYISISHLLDLHPECLEFINPLILLEMNRLNLIESSPLLHQSINIGFTDTGGFSPCSTFHQLIIPTPQLLLQTFTSITEGKLPYSLFMIMLTV
jgi:hypothetical protein